MFKKLIHSIWEAFVESGKRRAQRELDRLYVTHPEYRKVMHEYKI